MSKKCEERRLLQSHKASMSCMECIFHKKLNSEKEENKLG